MASLCHMAVICIIFLKVICRQVSQRLPKPTGIPCSEASKQLVQLKILIQGEKLLLPQVKHQKINMQELRLSQRIKLTRDRLLSQLNRPNLPNQMLGMEPNQLKKQKMDYQVTKPYLRNSTIHQKKNAMLKKMVLSLIQVKLLDGPQKEWPFHMEITTTLSLTTNCLPQKKKQLETFLLLVRRLILRLLQVHQASLVNQQIQISQLNQLIKMSTIMVSMLRMSSQKMRKDTLSNTAGMHIISSKKI